jgi:transposase InsO family protein
MSELRYPNETREYRDARDALLKDEQELVDKVKAVAPKRRQLPPGGQQPLAAHQHWHIDVSSLNIGGTFYYLCSTLDGFSRYIVNWDIRESMTEEDIEIILQ